MTGSSELNQAEALATGAIQAQESLESFPRELKVASLYLALTAQRSSFNLVVNDVYLFMKDRYFVGEVLQACLEGKSWSNCTILQVREPSEQEVDDYHKVAVINSVEEDKIFPPACLYKYSVQKFCSYNDINRVFEAGASHVRRKKRLVTKGKLRVFLKQCLILDSRGIWAIQDSVLQNYGIHSLKFGDIFVGSPPKFPLKYEKVAKKIKKNAPKNFAEQSIRGGVKKVKLNNKAARKDKNSSLSSNENMSNFKNVLCRSSDSSTSMMSCKVVVRKLSKCDGNNRIIKKVKKKYAKPEGEKENLNQGVRKKYSTWRGMTLEERQKLKEKKQKRALLDKMKRKEERLKEKEKRKEEKLQMAILMKDHNRLREDLECEDLKPLPVPRIVKCLRIPNELFGEFMMIVEFFHCFKTIVKTKNYFPRGITCEFLETALTENSIDGSLSNIVILLLTTVFRMQGEDNEIVDGDNGAPDIDNELGDMSTSEVIRLAVAEYSTQLYQEAFVNEVTLNYLTVTEVLRLHFISCSGDKGDSNNDHGTSVDPGDPVTILRTQYPCLLHDLCERHVSELSLEKKVGIISCLIDQVLACPHVREELEKRGEDLRQRKTEIRAIKAAEVKKAKEAEAQRIKEKKEAKLKLKQQENPSEACNSVSEEIKEDTDQYFEKELRSSRKKPEIKEMCAEMRKIAMEFHPCPIGFDRAHRRFWIFSSLPGIFVEQKPFEVGPCLLHPTPRIPLSPRSDGKWLARKNSPHKSPNKKTSVVLSPDRKTASSSYNSDRVRTESWICTSNAECPVHCQTKLQRKWSYFHREEEVTMLLENLNKRGLRESELRKNLARDEQWIREFISKCPLKFVDTTSETNEQNSLVSNINSTPEDTVGSVLDLLLRDRILDLENKLSAGCLGYLDVSDINAWRNAIENGDYEMQCDKLSWGMYSDPMEKSEPKESDTNYCNKYEANILSKVDVVGGEFVLTQKNLVAAQTTNCSPKKSIESINRVLEEQNGQNSCSSPRKSERKSQDGSSMEIDNVPKVLDPMKIRNLIRSLSCAILQLEQAVDIKYIRKPLVEEDDSEDDKIYQLKRWETSLMTASSYSQLFLHLSLLDFSIHWSKSVVNTRCVVCRKRSDAENMLLCDGCNRGTHTFCLKPKLMKVPEGDWYCQKCQPESKKEQTERKKKSVNGETTCREYGKRPSKSRKIVHNDVCEACGLRYNLILCSSCPLAFHPVCVVPPLKEPPEGLWTCRECESQGVGETEEKENEVTSRRSSRRKSGPSDLSLNNSVLQDLLSDLMCHKDSWPFLQPVRKAEAPRYHIVVKKPMDFGTMKYKLNRSHYKHNSEFIDDALLVFANCRMYNENDADVYKCGARLSEYFKKRCKDLGLHCRD